MSATPAYVLSCEGKPAGLDACGNQMRGPAGCTVEETRRIAATAYGWLTRYGDLCPACVGELLAREAEVAGETKSR